MKNNKLILIAILFVLFPMTLISCMKKKNVEPVNTVVIEEEVPRDLVHRVSYSGETLAMIANWYTGKSANWKLIQEANSKIKPERIVIGQEILIPANLITQRNPLPKKFVQESLAKRKTIIPVEQAVIKETKPITEETVPFEEPNNQVIKEDSQPPVAPPVEVKEIKEPVVEDKGVEVKKVIEDKPTDLEKQIPEKSNTNNTDEEREKLLDELLTQ